tara:strand:- start:150 stop:665 length:516 start_codon:yes stop_codon:yes gene_type:complete
MNGKDKFIFFILLLLVLGAGYYYTMTESIFLRMDQLQTADKKHVDKVLGAYADSLDRYNLRFIGRGKHMRKMQKDISSNTSLIEKNTDSLATMVDDVSYTLDNFMRKTEKDFRNVNNDLEDLETDFKGTVRKLKQNLSDLEQLTQTLNKRLKEIEDLELIQEEKAEAAEKD